MHDLSNGRSRARCTSPATFKAPRKNLWGGTLSFTGLKFSKSQCIATKTLPWKVTTRLEMDFLRHELLCPMSFEKQARQVATRRACRHPWRAIDREDIPSPVAFQGRP